MLRTAAPPDRPTGSLPNMLPTRGTGVLHMLKSKESTSTFPFPLTERERQVLSLTAEGFTNKLIGSSLAISERTVKSHLTNIMTKLRASDRTHAVVIAVRLGWLAI